VSEEQTKQDECAEGDQQEAEEQQGSEEREEGSKPSGEEEREQVGQGEEQEREDAAERVQGDTIAALALGGTREHEGAALKFKQEDEWTEVPYDEFGDHVRSLAKALIGLNLGKGDAVAIFSDTRPEWVLADLAAAAAGLVVATIYHTSSAEEARHVLDNSDARVAFCESAEQLEKIEEVRDGLDRLDHLVLFEGDSEEHMSLNALREAGEEVDDEVLEGRVGEVSPDDLFTLVYTSGTTGPPKGCMLTHGNLRAMLDALEQEVDLGEDVTFYAFLPLAHVFTRLTELLAFDVGATLAFWQRDRNKLLEDLQEVKPTHFAAVPRIFEKIYNEATSRAGGALKGTMLEKAVQTGREARDKERSGETVGPVLRGEYELADRQIFSKVRDLFGGEVRLALTGAAPVAKEMLEFFDACGVLVLEGWGLSETSGAATVNRPDDFRFGTQGKPVPGCEVRIAEREPSGDREDAEQEGEDPGGEILVRGSNVFRGYYKMEEETREDLDEEGWFHTGDVGSFDDDGFLTITGRTKDIIVTSSGKNVPAARIENEISDHRWISQVVVYGDDKNYLVALVTLDEEERPKLAEQAGVQDDPQEMASSDAVRDEIQKAIDEANQQFARVEQVKKFAILEEDLSQERGELTPTLKVKRSAVYENHRDRFEALYEEGE
jgi:long-chain acyl-CoA synthetase